MRKTAFCIIAAGVLAVAAACSRTASHGESHARSIAVSIEPLRALLEPLASGRFDVTCVMDRGADPENYEPSMSGRMAVDDSEAFFCTGGLPFEQSLADAAPSSVLKVSMLDAVPPLYAPHANCGPAHAHTPAAPDPHIWCSARNARAMAAAMASALSRLDPEGAPLYAARLDSMTAAIDSLDRYLQNTLRSAAARSFMVWHPSLSYIARDYGLQQVALGAEGKDFSAAGLKAAIDRARAAGSRVFFVQRGLDSRQAAGVCREAGAAIVEIDPMSYNWQSQLKTIADEIARH